MASRKVSNYTEQETQKNPQVQSGAKRTHVFEIGSTSERYVEMLLNFLLEVVYSVVLMRYNYRVAQKGRMFLK